jgi:hypothetical protein
MKTKALLTILAAGLGGCSSAMSADRELEDAIAKNRMGTLTIEAAAGTEVVVEQQRHEFWFGAALANQAFNGQMRPEERDKYLGVFLTNFNAAVFNYTKFEELCMIQTLDTRWLRQKLPLYVSILKSCCGRPCLR